LLTHIWKVLSPVVEQETLALEPEGNSLEAIAGDQVHPAGGKEADGRLIILEALVDAQDTVKLVLTWTEPGTVRVQVGSGVATVTVTFVQALQLLFSFDSVITPPPADEVLSAQALMEYVPAEAKVWETVAVPLPPAARAPMAEDVLSVMVPPPLAAEATWKKLLNPAPVPAVPILEIVDEKV